MLVFLHLAAIYLVLGPRPIVDDWTHTCAERSHHAEATASSRFSTKALEDQLFPRLALHLLCPRRHIRRVVVFRNLLAVPQPFSQGDHQSFHQHTAQSSNICLLGQPDSIAFASNMSQYTYKPLPDSKRFIRLLSVVSAGDTISCALEDFPIDDPPPFYAVSYCWGTEPACEKIYVGSGCIALTLHLLEGIQSIHEQASPPKLWIDALCINQVDHVEKSGQIPLMSRIYGDAEKVLVWLGRGVEWSDRAMKWIPDLCEKLSLLGSRDLEDENRWQEVGIPPKNHLIWDGIRHIFSSTWFNRLWPLQEVTLAKEVEFFSGGASVKMKALLQLALDISDSDILVTPQMPTHQFNDGIIGVIAVATIRIDVPSLSTPGGAFRVLECSSRKESTEPLDYVYGVLGMLGRHISSRILVDYSASSKAEFWNVYVDLAAILLRENVYAVLGLVETKIRLPQLPSWCTFHASYPSYSKCAIAERLVNIDTSLASSRRFFVLQGKGLT